MLKQELKDTKSPLSLFLLFCSIFLLALTTTNSLYAQDAVDETESAESTELMNETDDTNSVLAAPTISINNPVESALEEIYLEWDAMDEASSYTFELCGDNQCTPESIILSFDNLTTPVHTLPALKPQQYYWQVSSVDTNGIVGNFTSPQPLLVSEAVTPTPIAPISTVEEKAPEAEVLKILNLPWYLWVVLLAYLGFILSIANWYFNGRR